MDTNKTTETIIKYLDGELSGEELKAFEQLLNHDENVKNERESLELAQKAMASYGLKAQIAAARGEMAGEVQGGSQSTTQAKIYAMVRPILQIAASLLFVLLAIGAYEYATVSPSKLYNESYEPYKASVLRGGDNSDLETAYVSGEKKTVIALFEKMTAPDNKASFLAGQVYLSIRQPKKAIGAFTNIMRSPNRAYKEEAEYYLALSYLQNDQPAKANALFKRIYQDSEHLYHNKVDYWMLLKVKLLILKSHSK